MDGCYAEYDTFERRQEWRKDSHGETVACILRKLVLARENGGVCGKR